MAIISDSTKIDKSFKFVSGKGYTTTNKGVDNEDAASGFIIGTSSIFSQDAAIPGTAPGTSTSVLTYYGPGTPARFRMIYDVSSPLNKAWYASTDGSSLTQMRATRVPNWVPPTFGNYTIRIFLTVGISTSNPALVEIFFSDATSPLFDYKTGILTFESDPLAAYASYPGGPPDGIQISGYVYTGPLLSQIFDGNGNFTGGLSDFGTSTALAEFVNPNKSFEVSSPFAIPTTWVSETTPYGTSSVVWKAVGQFPNGEGIVAGSAPGIGNTTAYSYGHGIWRTLTSIPNTVGTPNGVWCGPDDLTAYLVDQNGRIFRSLDAGRNWTSIILNIFITYAVWGSSLADIFVVGQGGNIVHATDGVTFSAQTNSDTHDLYAVWGSSSTDIFAVGQAGTIRHSVGAGTWTGQTSGTANDLHSVFGFSSSEIYAGGSAGTLLKSTGGGTWSSFNSGLPGTFTVSGLYGISAGNTKKLYAAGPDSSSNNYKVYVSSGSNSWTLEATYAGPQTQNVQIAGGTSGIFGGLDVGRIAVLHKYPVEFIHGHTRLDGYLSVHGNVISKNADLNSLFVFPNVTTSPSTAAITVNPTSTTNYVVLSSFTNDTGEGFRFWRESTTVYTLDVGSKVTTNNDGATPFAAGGRIRLGGFTTSPSTTARAEIETVSSVGLKIAAYQGDMTIANMFGTVGSTKGDINFTTQSGAIRFTATGNETPYPAGQIIFAPATNAYVLLSTNTTSSTFRTQSPGGNYNLWDGTGSFSNNGSISAGTTLHSGTSTSVGSSLSTGTYISAGSGIATGGNIPVGNKMESYGDINCWSGQIFCQSGAIIVNANNLIAQNNDSDIQVGNTATGGSPGSNHGGLHALNIPPSSAYYFTSWGFGFNPGSSARAGGAYWDTMAIYGARVTGLSSATVYVDHNVVGGTALDTSPYAPGGFNNEFGWEIEWHSASGTTGFTIGGRLRAT